MRKTIDYGQSEWPGKSLTHLLQACLYPTLREAAPLSSLDKALSNAAI